MGWIVQLIIAGVLLTTVLGGIYAAWGSFKDHIGQPYAEAQRLADQKIVDKAGREQAAAEADRVTANSNRMACESNLKTQESAKEDYRKQAARNLEDARNAKARAQREASAAAPKIAELQARAAAQPKLEACEVELSKARATMREALERRRGITPAPVSK